MRMSVVVVLKVEVEGKVIYSGEGWMRRLVGSL